MSTTPFALTCGDRNAFLQGPEPAEVRVPLSGHGLKTVKKKAQVHPGMLVADHPNDKRGEAHSPICGVVAEVNADCVVIAAQAPAEPAEGEEPAKTQAEALELSSLEKDGLKAALKSLGLDLRTYLRRAETLIINGLNPEPGIFWAEGMLENHKSTLEKGLELLKVLSPAGKVILAAHNAGISLAGASTTAVAPVYPNSVDRLLIAAVTGSENAKGVHVVGLHDLFILGRTGETGLPVTETVMTVQGKNYVVKVGTTIKDMLEHAGVAVGDNDRVVLGGPMRGKSVSRLDCGIGKQDTALFVVPDSAFPPVADAACINCGECILRCPARIRPNMLGRYSEFRMYDKCKDEYIDSCVECGLCAYWCVARRPVLQLIQLAKHQIVLQEQQVTACSLQGES
ncbi:NADH:quinone oxidoreductase subunit RnfC [Oleidesulfovibrio sp.]|uniref:NADH:quinone oxidoreductase subunit RnfC n=1 Tax=Oleidesulfovibrio sp. TaxID=2909707 RepID=UPI003A8B4ADE